MHRGLAPWLAGAIIALAVGTACTDRTPPSQGRSPSQAPAAEPTAVRDLTSIDMLRDRFEEDAGTVRLILLISPT